MQPQAQVIATVLRRQTNWRELWFYQKTVVLYQMTYTFTRRFLPAYGDRTNQREALDAATHELETLKQELLTLKSENEQLRSSQMGS